MWLIADVWSELIVAIVASALTWFTRNYVDKKNGKKRGK